MKTLARSLLEILCIVLVASCSLFDYTGTTPKKWALVYGVTTYALSGKPGDPNLSYPDADAKSVAALLTAQGYDVRSRWVDVTGEVWVDGADTGKMVGSLAQAHADGSNPTGAGTGDADAPSKANIEADIANLGLQVGPSDIVLIYFSGHGMQDATTFPPHEYIVPYGGVQFDATAFVPDYYGVFGTSIRDDELGSILSGNLNTPRKVLILDTCNSGGFIGNMLESDIMPPVYGGINPVVTPAIVAAAAGDYASFQTSPTGVSPYNAQVIAAAGRDESSYETGSLPIDGHGVMTAYFLQAAAKGDLNHDGHVTVLEAFSLVRAGIEAGWNADPQVIAGKEMFEPHVSGGPVDFVLF